ncbi:hypothetical protein pdam_00024321 [Pocillopora damicornis]|uniref:Uncharacterized protein n=1 Tax=Pocillopora damicornis TaxID=46731 RepID=A0A3M6UUA2_POCDA|nr:hypothetical protein pdam_00024321 [Pocillopora damicornis]
MLPSVGPILGAIGPAHKIVPPTNIIYNGYRIVEVNPTREYITSIEFVILGSHEYLDFSRSYFRMELV